MRPLRIALDCDGILADFVAKTISFAAEWGHARTEAETTEFNIFKAWGLPALWEPFNDWIAKRGQVAGMATIPGAAALVAGLRELGEVAVVTSPYKGAPFWIHERIEWLERELGFKPADVCVWSKKHWIAADVLIDDAAHNVNDFAEHGGAAILVDRAWNRPPVAVAPGVVRCLSYEAVIDEVRRLKERMIVR